MDDQVPFKVYTFWKEGDKPEVRRFGVEKTVVTSYHYMNAKLQDVYPGLKGKTYSVTWKDEDGDDVLISSDEEMMTALQALKTDIVKLNVYCKNADTKEDDCDIVITAAVSQNPGDATSSPALHYGVQCDGCDRPVVGFRYKCTSCDDYDLCSACEAGGLHPEHCMVRVPAPTMPRAIIKAAFKRSRHFLKTVAGAMGEECPYKRNRREKSGDRGKHRHHGHHRGGDREGHPHGEHHRRTRGSWLDTFATYMNEFANLAGDIDLDPAKAETKPQEQPTQPQESQVPQEKPQTSTESAAPPKEPKPASETNQTECPFMPLPGNINVNQIKSLMELYLGSDNAAALLNTFLPPQPSTSTQAPTATSDVEMGQGDRKAPEVEKVSIKSETAVSTSLDDTARDSSPDRADDWTMINKEKDLMNTPSAPNEPAAPIGFNLPEEFQERVKISEGGLYPPLNTSTAEPELPRPLQPTKVPASAPTKVPASAPPKPAEQPKPAQEKPATQPQPRQRHPKPHIDAAIQQMLAMGFTNDGGWLTQLLESKDGNIAAVLDLLTPVTPKK